MRMLICSGLVCAGLALPSTLASAEERIGSIFNVPIGTCHPTNFLIGILNKVFFTGTTTEHQALSSLPKDFSDIAAQNHALAAAFDLAFQPPENPGALRVAATSVRNINTALTKLKSDIGLVDPNWVNDTNNSSVWRAADEAALEKANFVHGELEVYLSNGPDKITKDQAAKISKDLRDQAERMEKMSTTILVALQNSPATGASQPIPIEDCSKEN